MYNVCNNKQLAAMIENPEQLCMCVYQEWNWNETQMISCGFNFSELHVTV